MKVQLLGTGSADGWPNAFCTCASCGAARTSGVIRGQTSALIDDRLLIDCGPEVPAAATRHGAELSGIRTLLITHGHPDHVGPAALLFRHWAGRGDPLDVYAPDAVLDQLRPWIGPDDAVHLHPVTAGDRFACDGFVVQALAATHGDATIGEAVLFDVTASDGARLLYATDTGPLSDATIAAVADAAFDVVLLEETFGDFLEHGTQHLDLATFPDQLRRLRAVGAVTDSTDVVAVHLSHHNPVDLYRRLAPWGARVVADGTVLRLGSSAVDARPAAPHRTLVLGGARSGKSRYAESLLAAAEHVTYIATAPPRPGDDEWAARVAEHRTRRPDHWTTVETGDVATVLLDASRGDLLLVDCFTLWLTRVMDDAGAWSGDLTLIDKQIDRLVDAWRATQAQVVAVSNEVGQGVVPATPSGRLFRDTQGRLNAAIARDSDDVVLMVAGRPVPL
ncbi:MAG: bifunctional adenosylcobinamide kinase/adenosylcobinamide-phosphate guanylyltransferase [Actinomycetia bacterium]|nr:bifunctional adenosylcobinamide kinase/adenosylcobinamide-phosphate guanylyltransferase [Actinomycetes bacterium]